MDTSDGRIERGRRTRQEILDAARRIVENAGTRSLTMTALARAAGVSRRTIYDQFGSRAGLLVALAQEADQNIDLPNRLARVFAAPTGLAAIARLVETVAEVTPRLLDLASAIERARGDDPDANAAWEDRMRDRMRGCVALLSRLAEEGRLRDGLSLQEGADILYTAISWQVWEILVVERGWSSDQWVRHTIDALTAALTLHSSATEAHGRE